MQVKSDDFNNFYIEISDFYGTATRRRKGGGRREYVLHISICTSHIGFHSSKSFEIYMQSQAL